MSDFSIGDLHQFARQLAYELAMPLQTALTTAAFTQQSNDRAERLATPELVVRVTCALAASMAPLEGQTKQHAATHLVGMAEAIVAELRKRGYAHG